jgi:hypothetical protein
MHPLTFLFSLDPSTCAEVFSFTLLLFCAQAPPPSDAPVLLCIPLLLSLSSGSAGDVSLLLVCSYQSLVVRDVV